VCTLAIYFQASPEVPVFVAANRDEFYHRAAAPPRCLTHNPWIVAGQDLVAGGTWLGVNAHQVVAGVLNRRTARPPDPTRRSRGLLCLDALRQASVNDAIAAVREQPGARYNPFNLLVASPTAAVVISNAQGAMAVTPLDPGLHLLTNLELNDAECPRIAKSYHLFAAARPLLRPDRLEDLIEQLRTILSDHSTPLDPRAPLPPDNLCVHTPRFGTRSSTLLLYATRARRFRMWHADGAPCETAYSEVALPPAA